MVGDTWILDVLQMMQLAALVFAGVVEGLASEPRHGLTFSSKEWKQQEASCNSQTPQKTP